MASSDNGNENHDAPGSSEKRSLFAGFDLGTSGCRVSILERVPLTDGGGFREVYNDSVTWKDCGRPKASDDNGAATTATSEGRYDDPESWWIAIETLLGGCSQHSLLESIASICVSGTSASCLMADRTTLEVTRQPRMYDYDVLASSSSTDEGNRGEQTLELLDKHLPPKHTARSTTGSFAKLVEWILRSPLLSNEILFHQSDYVSTRLLGLSNVRVPQSDWQNCLKLGYDVRNLCWPLEDWMEPCLREALAMSTSTSTVVSPGAPLGCIDEGVATQLGLSPGVVIVGGTTDSNAAFYAAAASGGGNDDDDDDYGDDDDTITIPYGTAVTSLGSTTAIKFLSKTYVEDSTLGVYSHRFPAHGKASDDDEANEAWLVGGASNVGCAVFRALDFSDEELKRRSADMDPSTDSEAYLRYGYYPLLPNKVGERFPRADPTKQSVLEPIPDATMSSDEDGARTEYLKGLFQSITTEVERKGYEVLRDLGASPPFPSTISTAGGGSKNDVWTSLRQRIMNDAVNVDSNAGEGTEPVTVKRAAHSEASYGAALLAAAGFRLRQ
eukprot:jgi/Psemu1/190000/e_gw1.95.91.1